MTDNLSKLSAVFDFDQALFSSNVYQRAFRGSIKQILRQNQQDQQDHIPPYLLSRRIDNALGRDPHEAAIRAGYDLDKSIASFALKAQDSQTESHNDISPESHHMDFFFSAIMEHRIKTACRRVPSQSISGHVSHVMQCQLVMFRDCVLFTRRLVEECLEVKCLSHRLSNYSIEETRLDRAKTEAVIDLWWQDPFEGFLQREGLCRYLRTRDSLCRYLRIDRGRLVLRTEQLNMNILASL